MRIRSTKPEFWRSKTIAQLDYFTRLVLKALEAYVDDNGVGKDPIESIVIFCADTFPHDLARDPSSICTQVTRSLRALCEHNLAVRYSVDGEPYIYVRRWKKWQYIDRPNKGRHPRPDGTLDYKDTVDETIVAGQGVTDPVDGVELRETCPQVAPNVPPTCPQNPSGEQGSRGTGEQGNRGADDSVPLPPEPPVDDWVAGEVVVDAPTVIDNPPKPAKRYASQAAKSVVRQELGNDYSDAALNRIGAQVENLSRQGKPDHLIRETLREWERRPNCEKPEFIPTVYDDLVKASRSTPATNGHDAKVNDYLAFATPTQNHLEIEP